MSISSLPLPERPEWLREIVRSGQAGRLPLPALLRDSLYDPAGGAPIDALVGNVHSFICAGISAANKQCLDALRRRPPLGYDMVYAREVHAEEVSPSRFLPQPHEITLEARDSLERVRSGAGPFGHWSVWKAREGDHAFSLLFLHGEMCSVFQNLYVRNGAKPGYLSIIRPDRADDTPAGGDVRRGDSRFHQLVMENPAGAPEYLISCGDPSRPQKPPWREYETTRAALLPEQCASIRRLKRN